MSFIRGLDSVAEHIVNEYLNRQDLSLETRLVLKDLLGDISGMVNNEMDDMFDYNTKIGLDDD